MRNSICHTSTVICNSFMHCGTTSDQFLRDNLDWLSRATNWAKFTATASLGVIHKVHTDTASILSIWHFITTNFLYLTWGQKKGHEKEALTLMSSYLPKDSSNSSPYSDGGGLYALGLIHANHGGEIIQYLFDQLKSASSEVWHPSFSRQQNFCKKKKKISHVFIIR